MSAVMTSEAMPARRDRRPSLKPSTEAIHSRDQSGYADDHDQQQWEEDADQNAAAARTVLAWTDAFAHVCKMESPLNAASELAEALLGLALEDNSERRIVHRLASMIHAQCDTVEVMRGELFQLTHAGSGAFAALDREIYATDARQKEGRG